MITEDVLECRRRLGEPRHGLTGDRDGCLGSIASTLGEDANAVKVGVGGRLGQAAHALAQPLPISSSQRGHRCRGGLIGLRRQGRRARGLDQTLDQVDVAVGAHIEHQSGSGFLTLRLQLIGELAHDRAIIGGERGRPSAQPLAHHLLVANAAEARAQPAQIGAQRVGPNGIEQRAKGPQLRAQPPGRDPGPMDIFRIVAQPHAGVVAQQAGDRHGDHVPHQVTGPRRRCQQDGIDLGRRGRPRAERSYQLGRLVLVGGPGVAQASQDRIQ